MPVILNEADVQTHCWKKLKAHLAHVLEHTRIENDSGSLTMEQTQYRRGRISMMKDVLSLGEFDHLLKGFTEYKPVKGEASNV